MIKGYSCYLFCEAKIQQNVELIFQTEKEDENKGGISQKVFSIWFHPQKYEPNHWTPSFQPIQPPSEISEKKLEHKGEDIFDIPFMILMPSPSAFSKFVLSVLKFSGILKFLGYTQNILGVLK